MSTDDEDKIRTVIAVMKLLRKAGIKAGYFINHEAGYKTLAIMLPGINTEQFIEANNDNETKTKKKW